MTDNNTPVKPERKLWIIFGIVGFSLVVFFFSMAHLTRQTCLTPLQAQALENIKEISNSPHLDHSLDASKLLLGQRITTVCS